MRFGKPNNDASRKALRCQSRKCGEVFSLRLDPAHFGTGKKKPTHELTAPWPFAGDNPDKESKTSS